MADKSVSITFDGTTFNASPDSVVLSKGHGHVMEWHNDTDKKISITFPNGTPFAKPQPYVIEPKEKDNPGPIKVDPSKTPFAYTISAASVAPADPEVIIQP